MAPERLEEALGLSEQQSKDADAIRIKARREAIQRRADVELAQLDLRELMRAATLDEKAIAAKVKVLQDLQAAALKGRIDQQVAFLKLLSPEQRTKLETWRAQWQQGPRPDDAQGAGGPPRRRMGPRPGFGPGPEPDDDFREPDPSLTGGELR
jgi:Spy/CpxP family protein refolding chaperone